MQRTKTIDVVTVSSSTGYIEPCNKISIIIDTIFKENFVRLANQNSSLYEADGFTFKQFIQNAFGKCHVSKESLAHIMALFDRIVSTTDFVLKPQNSNRLLVGLIIIVSKYNKLTKFFDKLFNIVSSDLEKIEKEVLSLLNNDIFVSQDAITNYVEAIYASDK